MCPELVTLERKKIEHYIRGLPKKVNANVTSSKPVSLQKAINMARELVEQVIQAKATRIEESNKRKWEDHQGNNRSHNHNTYHQQQNQRQEDAKAYVAAPTERKCYLCTRPLCNLCNLHHDALMCPELVTLERKKIEHYIRGLHKKVNANVTSSKPVSLQKAINMARELVEQVIQAKATRIGESNKRKWEDHQGNNRSHNHNTYHQQQNQRQEHAKAYVAAPTEQKGYLCTRPLCNLCNLHHDGQCPPKCMNYKRIRHQTKDCWSKPHVADKPPTIML
nr:hypothetical protein [Tanacetum cinerariifolium]